MVRSRFSLMLLGALAIAAGCQSPGVTTRIENVQREARYYEDQLYWYHYENRKLCQENDRLRKRVERMEDQAKDRNKADDIPPSLFKSGRGKGIFGDVAPETAPREIIDPTPPTTPDAPRPDPKSTKPNPADSKPKIEDTPPSDDDDELKPPAVGRQPREIDDEPPTRRDSRPARDPRARQPFGDDETDEPPVDDELGGAMDEVQEEIPAPRVNRPAGRIPAGKAPAGRAPADGSRATPPKQLKRSVAKPKRPVRSIQLTASGSRGLEIDGRPGDDAIEVVVEPRDREGRAVAGLGEIVVTLTDPSAVGPKSRLGSKTFSPEQLAAAAGLHPRSKGYLLEIPLTSGPLVRERVRVHVVFLGEDGAELETQGDVLVRTAPMGDGSSGPERAVAGIERARNRATPSWAKQRDDEWTARSEGESKNAVDRVTPASTERRSTTNDQAGEPTPADPPSPDASPASHQTPTTSVLAPERAIAPHAAKRGWSPTR